MKPEYKHNVQSFTLNGKHWSGFGFICKLCIINIEITEFDLTVLIYYDTFVALFMI